MRYGIQMLGSQVSPNFKEISAKAIADAKAASVKAMQQATVNAVKKIANPEKKTLPNLTLDVSTEKKNVSIMTKFGKLPKWQRYGAFGVVGLVLIKVFGK